AAELNHRLPLEKGRLSLQAYQAEERHQSFFRGRSLRFVCANSSSCFSLIDRAICREAPLRLDTERSPRFAAKAAPAAICCFFDFAGMTPTPCSLAGNARRSRTVPRAGGRTRRYTRASRGI